MKKSVYSLVLMDEVIKAVDRQAYRLGTSRSNLINQILAENLSCITPEMRMREIFSSISQLLDADFQILQQRSDSLMTLKTALEYKYRPTVNYKVELFRSPDKYLGTLRVHIRTQNASLINLFNTFFAYWINMENELLEQLGCSDYACELTSGCFMRKLLSYGAIPDESLGEAIYSYISVLDKAIKTYFSAPHEFEAVSGKLQYEYISQLKNYVL
ncbi:MAG: hypothetical protein E7497_03380 [Ruminococcus sp.]|nr:hypothetical protein [Ruminococcus sp.]